MHWFGSDVVCSNLNNVESKKYIICLYYVVEQKYKVLEIEILK